MSSNARAAPTLAVNEMERARSFYAPTGSSDSSGSSSIMRCSSVLVIEKTVPAP